MIDYIVVGAGSAGYVLASRLTEDGKFRLTGLLEHFGENMFSATMVARGKPAPDLFLYAAQRLAVVPDPCLVI